MPFKYVAFSFLLNISLYVCVLLDIAGPTSGNGETSTYSFTDITPHNKSAVNEGNSHCVQNLCKIACFNSRSTEIEKYLATIFEQNNHYCSSIEELRLYNYTFPENVLSYGFLGNYSDKVVALHIICSEIIDIGAGAFARGRFKRIYLENLQLKELKKDFFLGISSAFNDLTIIQKNMPLESVHTDFLFYVKFQIKYLTIEAGLKSVCNMTGGDILLNKLTHARLSGNDFGNKMIHTTFSKVSMLEYLDLGHSNLEYLPMNVFAQLTRTLSFLNLSYNKLKTIHLNVFGNTRISHALRFYAEGNEWTCSCVLQREMRSIFFYSQHLFCSAPESYKDVSVFDSRICEAILPEKAIFEPAQSINETTAISDMPVGYITDYEQATETSVLYFPAFGNSLHLMKLACSADPINKSDLMTHLIKWPFIVFTVTPGENLWVDIIVVSSTKSYDSFSLVWFSKVTTEYYKMEINYNEYGLGCYNTISFATTVKDLVPNTSYTFCLVLKQQFSVSPFNCKSIHVSNNLGVKSSAWLTRDMRMTALPLVIFSVIMFFIAGFLMIYLILQRRLFFLKGSKRVVEIHSKEVIPEKESARFTKEKEEHLASYCSKNRRKSTESEGSHNSYMSSNLYEDITAYRNDLNDPDSVCAFSNPIEGKIFANMQKQDTESCYLIPLEAAFSSSNLMQYAEMSYHVKRSSHDVPPRAPAAQPSYSLDLREL